MDLAYEHPPELYPHDGTPPAEAWDVQIPAPAPLVAWLELRRAAGQPSLLHNVAALRAMTVIATALPRVPMALDRHDRHSKPPAAYPHVHALVGMRDVHGEPVDQALVERVAGDAWIAHVDAVVDFARERPYIGLQWTPGGIAGVDHSQVPAFTCDGFYGGDQPVIVGHP